MAIKNELMFIFRFKNRVISVHTDPCNHKTCSRCSFIGLGVCTGYDIDKCYALVTETIGISRCSEMRLNINDIYFKDDTNAEFRSIYMNHLTNKLIKDENNRKFIT